MRKNKEKFDKAMDKINKSISDGIQDIAVDILEASNKEAPVDTGDMVKSSKVEANNVVIAKGSTGSRINPEFNKKHKERTVVKISYNTEYSAKQHEDTSLNHPNGGKAKFLSDPFDQRVERIVPTIQKHFGKNKINE